MDLEAYLEHLNSGEPVTGGSEAHLFMHGVSQEALRITAETTEAHHEPKQLPGPVFPAHRPAGG